MADNKVQMVIRLTDAERERIKEFASEENKSMNQYVLDRVLSNKDSKNNENDTVGDMTIELLSNQIATKDEQLNRMQNLLDQQQRITLAGVGERERKMLELNELKSESDNRNFFQRLFNL